MVAKAFPETDLSALRDEVADFFASSPSAQEIVDFRLSESSEHFISALLDANRTRGLMPDEQIVLDEYTRIERLVQAIKVRAFAA
jgi:hypothetical protein